MDRHAGRHAGRLLFANLHSIEPAARYRPVRGKVPKGMTVYWYTVHARTSTTVPIWYTCTAVPHSYQYMFTIDSIFQYIRLSCCMHSDTRAEGPQRVCQNQYS